MKLRPYHNPENVDESRVPAGWRFRYADEVATIEIGPCRCWLGESFSKSMDYTGYFLDSTYIVPVA